MAPPKDLLTCLNSIAGGRIASDMRYFNVLATSCMMLPIRSPVPFTS